MNIREKIIHTMFLSSTVLKKSFSEFLDEYNLSEMEGKFLYHLGSENNKKTCDLINYFKKHKSTVRQKTKALEDKGFIIIEQSLEDKRERIISLTEKGRLFYKKFIKIKEGHHNKIFQTFTGKEEEQLWSLLKKMGIKR